MFKYGLKLWSTNKNYLKEAVRLYDEGVYQYIELYCVPGSYDDYIAIWKNLNISFVIHAAHFRGGMNLAKRESETRNRALIEEAQRFADQLKADKIVVHPGIDGDIKETARQLKNVNDKRVLVENKPYNAIGSDLICNGTTPDEINLVMKEAGVGFCFDIGHAVCSANAHGQEYMGYLREFMNLCPAMYHLSDGDIDNVRDEHKHIGKGNYDLDVILKLLPEGAMVTVETDKNSMESLADFAKDIEVLRTYGSN